MNKQPQIKRIFLDIDGVLMNFTKGAADVHNLNYPKNSLFEKEWLSATLSDAVLWQKVQGHDFWANLEKFPWADRLIKTVSDYTDNWVYLTKPSFDPGSYSGKYESVRKNFGNVNKLWLVNGDKSVACRGPEDLLIDDMSKNTDKWAAAGGTVFRWIEATPDIDNSVIEQRFQELDAILHPSPITTWD